MRSFLLAAAAVLSIVAGSAVAQPPEDAAAYHLITVTQNPPSPAETQLLASLQSNARLLRIAESSKQFHWTTSDELYRSRYAAALPPTTLPIIALVRSDGGVIYKASGANIPAGDALAEAIMGAAFWDRRDNPRPIPALLPASLATPTASPMTDPMTDPATGPMFPNRPRVVDMIPDTVNVGPTLNIPDAFAWIAGGVALIAVAAAGFGCMLMIGALVWLTMRF